MTQAGIYPKAIQKLIPPGANDPRIKACGVVFHVAVSTADSLHDYFDGPSGGIESHFYVRFDGTVEQYRSTLFEADAQYAGNSFNRDGALRGFISVETEGMGDGTWTKQQLQSLVALGKWAQAEHGFKGERCTGPYSDGYGYHSMFTEWNTSNHSCPGPERVKQFDSTLLHLLTTNPHPTRVEEAQALLEKAKAWAKSHGKTQRAKDIDTKINTGPKK